ncbi:MAG TPA: GxxExxY protein [Phycisphaerales bacterium]|nr:GxxExxY protein [Phycisphaerales bacterium]
MNAENAEEAQRAQSGGGGLGSRTNELPDGLNRLSERVIGCAIEVHRQLGPGLLERIYEDAMVYELHAAGLLVDRQVPVPVRYKDVELHGQRLDIIVERQIVLELKAVEKIPEVYVSQLVSYLRISDLPLGLLINFNVPILTRGIHRRINSAALEGVTAAFPSASSASPLRTLRSD